MRIPPDRLLVLPYGRIASDPAGLIREVEVFLGLDPFAYSRLDTVFHRAVDAVEFPGGRIRILVATKK